MRSVLFTILFGALSLSAAAAPTRAPVSAPDLKASVGVSGSSLSLQGQAVRVGDRDGWRVGAGTADELGLSVGAYELEDQDGSLAGELRVRADGSLVVLPDGDDRADSHARVGSIIIIAVPEDEECTKYFIIIDGNVYIFYDCVVVVTA